MDEDTFLNNLTIGMWKIENGQISYDLTGRNKLYITDDDLKFTRYIKDLEIWDMGIHFASRSWCCHQHLADLIKARSIIRLIKPEDFDFEREKRVENDTLLQGLYFLNNNHDDFGEITIGMK